MKILKLTLCLVLATLAPRFALADLVGPYAADANTLFLLHFDEAAGGTFTTNNGSKGGKFYSVNEAVASATPPTVTTMLGAAGYVNGPTNFNNCMINPTTGYEFGYDANNSGAYQGEGSAPCPDAIVMTNLNMGFGGKTPWTLEALIRPNTISVGTQEIICTDSSGTRGFQFRVAASQLQFASLSGTTMSLAGNIPTTGNDAFVAGNWYHVAATYDGAALILYWTLLNGTNGAAHILISGSGTMDATFGVASSPLIIGNENRSAAGEQFQGSIDEVRISSVARGSGQMQFYSPRVTITQNPVSQNVDYNQPVTFTIGAASQFPLGYQWRFNSNSIAGATNTSYIITNVAAGNRGYYDCVITNTAAFTATSSPALLVVGAANFIANRYSFTTDTTDSIGGQTGTNFGTATVSGGKLVLDGTSGTYMQLPPSLFNGANATALTVEFWATYGTNPNNVYAFAFGNTNFIFSQGIVGVACATYAPHTATGQSLLTVATDPQVNGKSVTATGNLDGRTVHVVCVIDPPNKTLAIYTNGILESVDTNYTGVSIAGMNDQFSYIGRSLWPVDPYLNASIDELRIFKGALSPITIKQSDDQGSNTLLADGPGKFTLQPVSTTVAAGQTATFSSAAIGYLPITYQWFKNGTLVPGATNATYSFAALIGDNGATFLAHATNIIGVTTYVTNSTSATLTVFIPPTLAWLDAANGGSGDGLWNTSSLNWTNDGGAGPIAFTQTNGVLFDSRGGGSSGVDLVQAITPYNITVNSPTDYTFTSASLNGSLEGQATIKKLGVGTLIIDVSNNLSGPVTITTGKLQVGNNAASGTLGSSVVTNNAILSLSRGDTTLNVGNIIHGTGTLSVDGSGSVTISGNNDFSGSTFINSGIAVLTSSTGLGATSAGTTVANGAQLYVTGNVNVSEGLTLNGAGDGNGALRKGGAGLTVENGPVSLASDSTIVVDGGATLALSNVVSGAAVLTAGGGGALTLNTNNTFTGGLVVNGAIVGLYANNALGTAAATVSGNGRFVLGDGVNIATPINATVVSPGAATGLIMVNDNTNGTVTTYSGPATFGGTATTGGNFAGPTSSGYLNISGPVSAGSFIMSVRFGNVRFSGAGSSYSELQIRANTTSIGANNSLVTNAVVDIAGNGSTTVPTYLDLNGFNQQLGGLKNIVGPANLAVVTNSSATAKTLTLDLGTGNTLTFGGSVAGRLDLVLNSGIQVFTGTNSYTGNTTVNGGTLELAAVSLATNSTVTVANGATLELDFADTNRIASLVLNGVTQAAGVYNNATSPAFITGTGSLLVAPSVNTTPTNITATVSGSTLTLTWPSDHTGWRLQSQTNSLSSGLSTNWVDVPGTAAANTYNATISPNNGAVFYRMVYP